ncbi:transposase [Methylobacterium adhaesivum]|uniref:transposase n=1 Tax=Methylobacterium adhaesivum TaxID=333297 RepID=UPI00338DED14
MRTEQRLTDNANETGPVGRILICPNEAPMTEEVLYWVSDEQWKVFEAYIPRSKSVRADERRTLSGILYVLLNDCRWPDCPKAYGSQSTVYQTFRRWRHRPFWTPMLLALAEAGWTREARALDPIAISLSRPARHGRKIDQGWRQTNRKWLSGRTDRVTGETED